MNVAKRWAISVATALFATCHATIATAQPSARAYHFVEELRIDGTKEGFDDLPGFLVIGPRGEIAFADLYSFKVLIFGQDGRRIGAFGARGAGPGEFTGVRGQHGARAALGAGLVGDTLWVYDVSARRTTFTSLTGNVFRTAVFGPTSLRAGGSAEPPLFSFAPAAFYRDGSVLGELPTETVRGVPTHVVVRVSRDGQRRSVGEWPADGATVSLTRSAGGPPSVYPVPLAAKPLNAFAQDGNRFVVVVPSTNKFTVRVVNGTGGIVAERAFPFTGVPISTDQATAAIEGLIRDLTATVGRGGPAVLDAPGAEMLRAKLRGAVPKLNYPVKRVEVGVDNSIWLMLASVDGVTPWVVLDDRCVPIATLKLSGKMRNVVRVARDKAWVIERDDDGVPTIVRYKVVPD